MDAVPAEMAFVRIDRPGPPEVLVPDRMAVPQPAEGEVLIKVAAAGINRPDVLQRQGAYPPPPGASDVPGLEVAGEVVGAGPGRGALASRRPVMALVSSGGYAEYCTAPAPQVLPVPERHGAGRGGRRCPRPSSPSGPTCSTAAGWRRARASSSMAARRASAPRRSSWRMPFGATVFATVGGPDKQRACEALGATRAIDYRNEDFVGRARDRDRRARRRRDPRHGRRRPMSSAT